MTQGIKITSTAHGLSDGSQVTFVDLPSFQELNGNTYLVSDATDDTFKLKDADTGLYTVGDELTGPDPTSGSVAVLDYTGTVNVDRTLTMRSVKDGDRLATYIFNGWGSTYHGAVSVETTYRDGTSVLEYLGSISGLSKYSPNQQYQEVFPSPIDPYYDVDVGEYWNAEATPESEVAKYALTSDGTGQYIDTGVTLTPDMDWEWEARFPDSSFTGRYLGASFGSINPTSPIHGLFVPKRESLAHGWRVGGSNGNITPFIALDTSIYEEMGKRGTDVYAGTTQSRDITFYLNQGVDPQVNTARLFAIEDTDELKANITYLKVWPSASRIDNDIIIDLIAVPMGDTTYSSTPAPSNCMWDIESETYFEAGNLGASPFGITNIDPEVFPEVRGGPHFVPENNYPSNKDKPFTFEDSYKFVGDFIIRNKTQ